MHSDAVTGTHFSRPFTAPDLAFLRHLLGPDEGVNQLVFVLVRSRSSNPVSPLSSSAALSSFQAASNCAVVRTCPNSYRRTHFSRMFRVRTNDRAVARVSLVISANLPPLLLAYYSRTLAYAKQAPLL